MLAKRSTTAKLVAVVGAMSALLWYLAELLPWSQRRDYMTPSLVGACALAALIAALSFSAAILLLTRANIWRVSKNVAIIFVCFAVGWWFGDPMSRGSYDHGWGETERSWVGFGILGTLTGYTIVVLNDVLFRAPRVRYRTSGSTPKQEAQRRLC